MLYALTSAYSRKDYDNHQQGRPLETSIGKLFSLFAWGLDIVQENAEDVYAEAVQVNEKRAAEEMEFEDESEAAADFQETPVSEV